ncbi:MAG: DedA family protein [Betaproteobacteria bacterium]|nr:DedA family protein [Betaproteobacteria bacterium]
MEIVLFLWDLAVHLDRHLASLLHQYGNWVYLLLFVIIFCETGLVVTPFLPGDSLLFVAGALWAAASMDAHVLAATLIAAAVLGDNLNYWIGRYLGPRVFRWEDSRFFNRQALERTRRFYERHGGKTVVIARWLPLVRTFAPFVAGVGRMAYPRFLTFSVGGGALWVLSLVYLGVFFGNLPVVKQNLTLAILVIIAVSLVPLALEYLRHRLRKA